MANNIYKLNIKISNLKEFNIDIQTSINNNLLLKGSNINIANIINNKINISNARRQVNPKTNDANKLYRVPFYDLERLKIMLKILVMKIIYQIVK